MIEFVNFNDLVINITRGVQLKAEELNKLKTNLNTGYYYLMLSHITKGVLDLDKNPQYLSNIPRNYDKYCIEDESLLISKIGLPLKTIVVESLGHKKVLATGNVYIAKIDTSKINVYYLQAFLQSEQGLESLKKIAKGKNIKNISLKQLMTLKIPVPVLEKQEMIANEYKLLLNEIKDLKKKIRLVENRFSSLWLSGIEKKESDMKKVLFRDVGFKHFWADSKDTFYKDAWKILDKNGLTSYDTEKQRYLILARQLVLEDLYSLFSKIAYGEEFERDFSHIEYEFNESLLRELYEELFLNDEDYIQNHKIDTMIESIMIFEYDTVRELLTTEKTPEELFRMFTDESFDQITYSNILMWFRHGLIY